MTRVRQNAPTRLGRYGGKGGYGRYCTSTDPVCPWMVQLYANVPAVPNVRLNVAPPVRFAEAVSANVTLCAVPPEFHVHVTVVPTGTSMLAGSKKSFPTET